MVSKHVAVENAQLQMDTIKQLKEQARGSEWFGKLYRMTIEIHQDALARFMSQAFSAAK